MRERERENEAERANEKDRAVGRAADMRMKKRMRVYCEVWGEGIELAFWIEMYCTYMSQFTTVAQCNGEYGKWRFANINEPGPLVIGGKTQFCESLEEMSCPQ